MRTLLKGSRKLASACLAMALAGVQSAHGQIITDVWQSVAVPPPPEVQSFTVDSAQAALLILDMYTTFCSEAQRPRCVLTIPRIQRLLAEARARKMMVVYSGGPPNSTNFTMPPAALTPLADEPMVRSNADKWLDTDLEKMLKARGVRSVIITGTSAEGAVLYTAGGAALRGFKVIIPIDAISSANPFGELSSLWNLKNTSGSVASHVTLSRTDLITLR